MSIPSGNVTMSLAWAIAANVFQDGTIASRCGGYGSAPTSGARTAVQANAFTPPSATGQRSIKSTSTSDVATTGTGAWTVQLNYLNSSFVSMSETITLNGTTAVNTVGTDILYIENMIVLTVGSTGSNVGTINLYTATAGGGTVIGGINPTDNQTFWAHHYVPTGVTCYVLSFTCGATLSSGYSYLNLVPLGTPNTPGQQIGLPVVHLAGNSEEHDPAVPYVIPGPALLQLYEVPSASNASNIALAGFEYIQG
jgi:hypothetical protein